MRCWRARRLEQRRSNAPTLQVLAGSFAGKLPAATHKTGNKMLRSRRRRASAPRGAGEAQEGGASAGFPEDAATLQRLLVAELRGELKRRGLPVSGRKAALVQRLLATAHGPGSGGTAAAGGLGKSLAGLLLLLIIPAAALASAARTFWFPEPLGEDAPVSHFSEGRALRTIRRLTDPELGGHAPPAHGYEAKVWGPGVRYPGSAALQEVGPPSWRAPEEEAER